MELKFACRFPDHFQFVPQRDRIVAKSCCQFEFPGVDGVAVGPADREVSRVKAKENRESSSQQLWGEVERASFHLGSNGLCFKVLLGTLEYLPTDRNGSPLILMRMLPPVASHCGSSRSNHHFAAIKKKVVDLFDVGVSHSDATAGLGFANRIGLDRSVDPETVTDVDPV